MKNLSTSGISDALALFSMLAVAGPVSSFQRNIRKICHSISHTAALAVCLLWPAPASLPGAEPSPPLTEYQVKALFLLNFIRYVEWPDGAFETEDTPFTIGVIGVDPFGDNLVRLVRGKTVSGRAIVAQNVVTDLEIRSCHILFVSSSERSRMNAIREAIGRRPVLTVGDDPRFLRHGGVVQFLSQGKNIRLMVNLKAAREGNLRVSSQLLQVAESVIDQ